MTRMSLKQLAKSRGMVDGGIERNSWHSGWYGWSYGETEIAIEAPTRRAAEAGLRACLLALPEKARKK